MLFGSQLVAKCQIDLGFSIVKASNFGMDTLENDEKH